MATTTLSGEIVLSGEALTSAIEALRELLATPLPTKPTRLRLLSEPLALLLQIAHSTTTPEAEDPKP